MWMTFIGSLRRSITPFMMEQAGHVGGGDVLGAMAMEVVDAVIAHLGRDRLVGDAEAAAEAAAFIGPVDLDQLEAPDLASKSRVFEK